MDRTPASSLRPTRATAATRSRIRTRPMSPSPRPNTRRPFTDPATNTMFITTDCEYDYISPSSPDSDFIFNMSPIHTHFYPPSPSNREPVNVMTLRNKTQRRTMSPPLSPMLYSFPMSSRLNPHTKQNSGPVHKDRLPKPLSSISQNKGAPTLGEPIRLSLSSRGVDAGSAAETRPLTASLLDPLSTFATNERSSTPITNSRSYSPKQTCPSSPIPIPRHIPRRSDPGPFVIHPRSLSVHIQPNFDDAPLPSSGIASHGATTTTGFRGAGSTVSSGVTPAGSTASSEPVRIEGFDDTEHSSIETDKEKSAGSLTDLGSRALSSTYSYAGSGPFRFSKFLDPGSDSATSGVPEKATFLPNRAVVPDH